MKTRVISAIVMIAIFVPLLIIGKIPYIIFSAILSMAGMWELLRLEKIPKGMQFISYIVCLFIVVSSYLIKDFNPFNYYLIIGLFLAYTIIMIIYSDLDNYSYEKSLWLLTITLMIGFMFKNFIDIRYMSIYLVIYLFLISTMTDTFALFCGKKFGKHKLIPKISPNKTIEGSIGGSIFGTIIPSIFYYCIYHKLTLLIVLQTLILTIICQFGDLFFSSIKRHYNIKDFSNLIPGHGGILDRLDSILFVMSAYLLIINII